MSPWEICQTVSSVCVHLLRARHTRHRNEPDDNGRQSATCRPIAVTQYQTCERKRERIYVCVCVCVCVCERERKRETNDYDKDGIIAFQPSPSDFCLPMKRTGHGVLATLIFFVFYVSRTSTTARPPPNFTDPYRRIS